MSPAYLGIEMIQPGKSFLKFESFPARVDLGGIAAKGYSTFPKAGALLSDCLVSYPGPLFKESYSSAEMQLVYSAGPDDWTKLVN